WRQTKIESHRVETRCLGSRCNRPRSRMGRAAGRLGFESDSLSKNGKAIRLYVLLSERSVTTSRPPENQSAGRHIEDSKETPKKPLPADHSNVLSGRHPAGSVFRSMNGQIAEGAVADSDALSRNQTGAEGPA